VNSIVVYLDPLQGGGGSACSVKAPFNIDNPHAVSVVSLDEVLALNGPNLVRQMGELLATKICENTAVKAALDLALAQANGSPSLPICFRVGDPVAHGLGWEALVGNHAFLALDERWPIARIARGGALEERPRRSLALPLRLVCVLSAVQVDAIDEWTAIQAAVTAARAANLDVKVTVFSGQESVVTTINGLGDADITAQPVPPPGGPTGLVQAIESLEPHLLHLFCHGTIANGVRLLEIGTAPDFDRDDGTSSVKVNVEELGRSVARAGAWAVVLNTCRGAQASDESLTHAEQLVSAGVPAAVGMKRQVDVADAVAFTAAFYPELFDTIGATVAKGPGEQSFSWADLLIRARRGLRDLHGADPDTNDSWTMPVLYGTPGGFSVVVPEPHAHESDVQHTLAEAGLVDGLVDAIAPEGAPPDFLDALRSVTPAALG